MRVVACREAAKISRDNRKTAREDVLHVRHVHCGPDFNGQEVVHYTDNKGHAGISLGGMSTNNADGERAILPNSKTKVHEQPSLFGTRNTLAGKYSCFEHVLTRRKCGATVHRYVMSGAAAEEFTEVPTRTTILGNCLLVTQSKTPVESPDVTQPSILHENTHIC